MSEDLDNLNESGLPEDAPVEVESDMPGDSEDAQDLDPVALLRGNWRDAWQIPTMLVAGGLLMLGVAYGLSTRPEPDMTPLLTTANRLIESEQYQEAIELLNTEVYPWVSQADTPLEARAAYHLAKARSIYYGQRKLRIHDERNDIAVIREYEEAQRVGGVLEPRDMAALANTHISREQYKIAMQHARDIPESKRYLRDAVFQRAIETLLDRPRPMVEPAMELIAEFLLDPKLPIEQRIWAMETQGRVQLDQGHADLVITRMLRELPRLENANAFDRSRLRLILAQAYVAQGAVEQADEQVRIAKDLAAAGDPHYPKVLLMKAMVEDERGNTAEARNLYDEIVQNHANSDALPLALLGVGETEAVLGEPVLSLEAYARLVRDYDTYEIESYPSREQVLESILARSGEALSLGEPFDAAEYARLGAMLFDEQQTPSEVFLALARAHEGAAEALLGMPIDDARTLLGLDPSARAEVQRHMIIAASNYSLHAERHVVTNLPVFADSLWRSADLFDRAGDQPEAISAFQNYAESMPSDPRHAEALFRLAEALRAMGDFSAAADVYKGLIEAKEESGGTDIGALADASRVPLAQAYLYDEDPENDAQAESLLASAIDGSMGTTDTQLFRDALLELAGLYDRTDRPERAIERYEEFRSRYEDDPETAAVVFRLADAHRRLADSIEQSLQNPMPAAERNRRTLELNQHRRDAITRYTDAIERLDRKPPSALGIFETIALRNAHFYLGDCAFDLREYDRAINFYDLARDRYGEDPASLVAMVQIVNAYIQTGQIGRARTANERAKRFYAMMPDEVWDDPTLPMDRADWEDWLASSTELLATAAP
ncbi:MAG: tetratricopeptide repeat protein [Phycisphaerales bacterium]|nr:tetratricopeptide repeat protein [Phycisphaerales bacterium]